MSIFSIIVPVYKVEEYIDKCVMSILNQTFSDFELILVDDGSPDNCPELCDEYAKQDSRVKVIHKPNGGVSSARNEGVKIANGDYIWFVDSDDYVQENSLEVLCDYISKTSADLYVFEHGFNEFYELKDMNGLLCDHYYKYDFGFEPWNKVYKRSLITDNKLFFDTQEKVGEDLLFNINYYTKMNSCLFIPEKLYHYVVRENSAMTTVDKERYKKQMRLFFKIRDLLESTVSQENLAILFMMHMVSGLNQSFANSDFFRRRRIIKYYKSKAQFERKVFTCAVNKFLKNENASFLGKCKVKLLFL
ncbi:MAG: glycosyltransferase family 2 protein [Ruminococcus sp.]|nr:glycosyltransferase family 2 protein [Ruminococcus sp.]